ncbi:hypothetical protein HK101_002892 [Irineochytrium annulatum]|nr:hypothetical protein HK101_002892 [Irineochytrium annulatum]
MLNVGHFHESPSFRRVESKLRTHRGVAELDFFPINTATITPHGSNESPRMTPTPTSRGPASSSECGWHETIGDLDSRLEGSEQDDEISIVPSDTFNEAEDDVEDIDNFRDIGAGANNWNRTEVGETLTWNGTHLGQPRLELMSPTLGIPSDDGLLTEMRDPIPADCPADEGAVYKVRAGRGSEFWEYFKGELVSTDFDESHDLKKERVKNFLSVPQELEKVDFSTAALKKGA